MTSSNNWIAPNPHLPPRSELSACSPHWLVAYPRLPVALLVLLPFVVRLPQWILGLSTNPILFFGGIVQGQKFGVLSSSPFIDPNVGTTSQALGHLAASDWLH